MDNKINISIEDNGIGVTPEKVLEVNNNLNNESIGNNDLASGEKSIGLQNVNYRIKLYYGKEHCIHFESLQKIKTITSFSIPYESGGKI
jgi:two-component system sensor histidine kinase YesM